MDEKNYLSKEKFDELENELEELKTVKRKEVAQKLEYAKALGDLSENAEYQEAREAQAAIEDRISTLEAVLMSAVIVSTHRTDKVGIGSKVTLQKKGGKASVVYEVVGSEESNVDLGKISNKSPLGLALIGKVEGEVFSFKAPGGEISYTVLTIA